MTTSWASGWSNPAAAPVFARYLNTPKTTPPQDLLTDICLPLR